MTTPTLDPRDRAAKTRTTRTTTGITVDCTCGATNVPLGWGWRLYKHVKAEPYRGKAARGAKCLGPRDLFAYMLLESKLMMAGNGQRYATLAEHRARDASGGVPE